MSTRAVDSDQPQLHMVWPASRLREPPAARLAPGYAVRTFRPGDEQTFLHLMSLSDFDPWDEAKLAYNLNRALPTGWFFAVDRNGQPVATAVCLHNYSDREPFTGDVGWVFCHPDHRGRSLGLALCARATRRFLEAGYEAIQLHTECHRLPAIKTYLKLGFVPRIASPEAARLWVDVCARLDWPFVPEAWSRA